MEERWTVRRSDVEIGSFALNRSESFMEQVF